MVIRLSKVTVTTGPTVTRRSFLAAMTSRRNAVALALVGALVGDVLEGQRACGHGPSSGIP